MFCPFMNDCIRFNRPRNLSFQKSVYVNFFLQRKVFLSASMHEHFQKETEMEVNWKV